MAVSQLLDDLTDELPAPLRLTPQDLAGLVEELAAYHAHFAPLFQRRKAAAYRSHRKRTLRRLARLHHPP